MNTEATAVVASEKYPAKPITIDDLVPNRLE